MSEVTITAGKLRKRKFKLSEENENIIKELAEKYGLSAEEIMKHALNDDAPMITENVEELNKLREEINALLRDMFIIEGKWSAIRYKSHTLTKDVKSLAVALIGELNQNRMLRKQLKKEKKYDELRKKAEYYLFEI